MMHNQHICEDWEKVDRVLIKGWWYNVTPGTFRGVLLDCAAYAEYMFDYKPKGHRFGDPDKTMRVSNEIIDAIQYIGGSK
jgi:hypothetical protein